MNSAEIRAIRESLGLSQEELATFLAGDVRSVRRWDTGQEPIHDDNADSIRRLVDITNTTVRQKVINLRRQSNPAIVIYRSDDDMWADHPALAPLPARWHRIIAARVAEHVPGLVITYAPIANS